MQTVTRDALREALAGLGVRPGDAVAFHTSLSAFGWIDGGADAVIDALLDAVGPAGTALAPTLTYARAYCPEHPPEFDARATPSVTGRTPEVFRARPGALRSLHPTHSWTMLGARAGEFARGHEDSSTPCGPQSPLGRLAAGGKVVLFGVSLRSCTFIHHCEEVARCPYHLQDRPTHCAMVDSDGRRVERDLYLHRWPDEKTDFTKPEPDLLRLGIMRKARVGQGEVRAIDARAFAEFLIPLLRREPRYLLAEP